MTTMIRRLSLGLALVLMTTGLTALVGPVLPTSVAAPTAAADEGRTWVVDAVDDAYGNRWVSADSGTSRVTIDVGDSVEWQFDEAAQDHDLTSQNTHSTWGDVGGVKPLSEYRGIDGEPVIRQFTEPGTFDYVCSIHGTMMFGQVEVVVPEEANQNPTLAPMADPASGPAPLTVAFMAMPDDPDGDALAYDWDFGTGVSTDSSTEENPMFTYAKPGVYAVKVNASDGRGGTAHQELTVTVAEGDGSSDPTGSALPAVSAGASVTSGTAPLAVQFSTDVTTTGTFHSYAAGLSSNPALTGTAGMTRSRGRTTAWLDVTGLNPSATHAAVHVHEASCATAAGDPPALAGAHFRFDTDQPFGEANEIWLPFTSDAVGRSGHVEVTKSRRAGPKAVSVVIHDPTDKNLRIGCADLAPSIAGLSYTWSFGDGTVGAGADPDHTYTTPGTYTATVMVSTAGDQPQMVMRSVTVTVGASAPAVPAVGEPGNPAPVAGAVVPSKIKSGAKKLSISFSASGAAGSVVNGTVKVYDGKKLVGTGTVVNGKVKVKLKKKLKKGKHKIKIVLSASATSQAKTITKTVKVRGNS